MAAESESLIEYINALKAQGASDTFIADLLKQNGWSEKHVYQAFAGFYEAQTGRAIPAGGGRLEAARDAFLYLIAFITLGIWAIQLGALLFSAIDRAFPNFVVDYANGDRWTRAHANQLASILVAFPLFLLVTRTIVRGIARQPEHAESAVRKWLTYIAMVITASTVIGDVVTFLAFLLRGDLSIRFTLKVATVFVIAGGVFAHYFDSLNRERLTAGRNRLSALAATVVVLFGVVVGFAELGSPPSQRAASQDARRLFDLSSIASSLHWMWNARATTPPASLPDSLGSISNSQARITDPVTNKPYEYKLLGGSSYQLCAEFNSPSPPSVSRQWQHGPGKTCFTLDARDLVTVLPSPF